MKLTKNLGMVLLAVWLIAWGVLNLGVVSFAGSGAILALLALAAGIVLLICMAEPSIMTISMFWWYPSVTP